MGIVGDTESDPTGRGVAGLTVRAQLRASTQWLADRTGRVVTAASTVTGVDGTWTLDLLPTGVYEDTGAAYQVTVGITMIGLIGVPAGPGPYRLRDLILAAPAPSTAPSPALISPDVNNQLVLHPNGLYIDVGASGTPGQPRFYGTGLPGLNPLAAIGDLYLDTATGTMYLNT